MLTAPIHGWTDFQLPGTSKYRLSYLRDVPFEWLDQAIHGLESLYPFTVEGFLEPDRFLCTVSYWNCYVLVEDDESAPMSEERIAAMRPELSHTNMLEFCQYLFEDISVCKRKWFKFCSHSATNREMLVLLNRRLNKLKNLIDKREETFSDGGGCFF